MNARRTRLDEVLVQRRMVPTRSRARALIMAGKVRVGGQPATKAGMQVTDDADLQLVDAPRYVSRGGDKLAAALDVLSVDPADKICIDIGASTGGFTDCLLQRGARMVLAVDVGWGQLAWRLRGDERVVVLERCNARHLGPDDLPPALPAPELLVMDVAFIGVAKLLPAAGRVCAAEAEALILVKPQFECGPTAVEAGGIVRSAASRRKALSSVAAAAERLGWAVHGASPSPLRGATGNWECFLHLVRPRPPGGPGAGELIAGLPIPDDRAAPDSGDDR